MEVITYQHDDPHYIDALIEYQKLRKRAEARNRKPSLSERINRMHYMETHPREQDENQAA